MYHEDVCMYGIIPIIYVTHWWSCQSPWNCDKLLVKDSEIHLTISSVTLGLWYFSNKAIIHLTKLLGSYCLLTASLKLTLKNFSLWQISIKTHSLVSAAKKDVRHTSVLFTGTAKSPFSTPHISITTGLISIQFTYYKPFIYTTWHTIFEENRLSGFWDMRCWKLSNFLHVFLLCTNLKQ